MSSPRLLLSTALLALSLTTATAQATEPDRSSPAPMQNTPVSKVRVSDSAR